MELISNEQPTTATSANAFKLFTVGELMEFPEPKWLVEGVILGGHPKPAINRHLKTGN